MREQGSLLIEVIVACAVLAILAMRRQWSTKCSAS